MWPFDQKRDSDWQKKMLERWVDLEARVDLLERIDKADVKRRKKIPVEEESKDIYAGMLLPEP